MAKDTQDQGLESLELAEQDNISYLNYLESVGAKGIDPLSPQGLSIQAEYVKALGEHAHPFDVLNRIMKNPFADPKNRIASAKTLLEYSHRKVPANLELSGKDGEAIKIDSKQLRGLSDQELDTLMTILSKAQGA